MADRAAMGAALKKATAAGAADDRPTEAVVREATQEELDAAFEDDGGAISEREQRRRSPGAGGVYLESPGGKNVATVPDKRALQNMRERAAKRQGITLTTASVSGPATAAAPVGEVEDWERGSTPQRAPAQVQPRVEIPAGDMLEVARQKALAILASLPPGMELFVGSGVDASGIQIVMGLGLLVGQGIAVYRGDSHYRLKGGN